MGRWILNLLASVFFGWAALDRFIFDDSKKMGIIKLAFMWGFIGIGYGVKYLMETKDMGLGVVAIMWIPVIFPILGLLVWAGDAIAATFGLGHDVDAPHWILCLLIVIGIPIAAFSIYKTVAEYKEESKANAIEIEGDKP